VKRYNIRGVELYQDDLSFEEYERVKVVLKDKVNIFSDSAQKFGLALDELFSNGTLKLMTPLFLKLYEPTPFHYLKNRWNMWRSGFDLEYPIALMNGEELAQVMVDFFLTNISWSTNLLVLPQRSNSAQEIQTGFLSRMKKSWSHFPTQIFQKQTQSND